MTEGLRYNKGKLRLELIPPEIKIALASVLAKGAEKYEDRNWEKGLDWMETKACLDRHLMKWEMGEELDEETGLPHLWHMLCNAAFLVTMDARKIGTDSRPLRKDLPTACDYIDQPWMQKVHIPHEMVTVVGVSDVAIPEPGEHLDHLVCRNASELERHRTETRGGEG